jgi:hypothetical protein
MSFESPTNEYSEKPKENLISIDNAREIFKMFDDAKITLAGEAQDIIFDATTTGYITEENLDKLLDIIKQSENEQEYE